MSFGRGLVVQWEVLSSLVVRETRTRYGNSRLGYFWALFMPIIGIGFFWGMMFLGRSRPPAGMDPVSFLTTGFLGYHVVADALDQASNGLSGNAALLVYPQVRPLDMVISRVCLEAITTSVVFAIIMTLNAAFLIDHLHIDDFFEVLQGFLLGTWLGGALGLCFATAKVVWPSIDRVKSVMMRPLLFVSGVFFTADGLPVALRDILVWNPILHAVEMIRSGWFGSYESTVSSTNYLLAWCIAATALGLMLEQSVRSRIEV